MNEFEEAFKKYPNQTPVLAKYFRNCEQVKKTYAILMTPRSGSTWLTHEIASYSVLSHPDEYFNPLLFTDLVHHNRTKNIYECFDLLASNHASAAGVFGFEITYFSLEKLEVEVDIQSLMVGEKYFFYLTRKNFVAQAISLYIATETGLYHVTNKDDPQALQSRPNVSYDGKKIQHWCSHILQQEYGFNKRLLTGNITPISISYEDMLVDIKKVVQRIAGHLYVELPSKPHKDAVRTIRTAPSYSDDYEARFRADYDQWCRSWEQDRGLKECLL